MKVALLYPLPGHAHLSGVVERMPTLSLYLLAALLRQKGHEVTLQDLPGACDGGERLAGHIRGADAVGVSANSFNWATALTAVRDIRSGFPELPIILGGIHPTYFDQHCLEVSAASFVVRGEGETSLPGLLDALSDAREPSDVPGLTYARNGRIARTPGPALLGEEELDRLPPPAYDLVPAGCYRAVPVQTSRGCVYECAFCSIPHRRGWRALGAGRCLELLQHALSYSDRFVSPGAVYFLDDCFTTNGLRATHILHELDRRGLEVNLGLEARANHLTEPVVQAIARLPCWLIQIGVECGYSEGLKRVGKGITLAEVESAAELLKDYGLVEHAVFSFIVGLPWETIEDCTATLSYALHLALRYGAPLSFSWYEPFPGSRIWSARADYGVSAGPEVFDGPGDWRTDPELFKAFRPRLTWDDCRRIEDLVANLARVVPHHLALFQTRVPRGERP